MKSSQRQRVLDSGRRCFASCLLKWSRHVASERADLNACSISASLFGLHSKSARVNQIWPSAGRCVFLSLPRWNFCSWWVEINKFNLTWKPERFPAKWAWLSQSDLNLVFYFPSTLYSQGLFLQPNNKETPHAWQPREGVGLVACTPEYLTNYRWIHTVFTQLCPTQTPKLSTSIWIWMQVNITHVLLDSGTHSCLVRRQFSPSIHLTLHNPGFLLKFYKFSNFLISSKFTWKHDFLHWCWT